MHGRNTLTVSIQLTWLSDGNFILTRTALIGATEGSGE